MARPIKQTVEYFPHDAHASAGRTLSILFNNFGHEGVSAWWQILESLAATGNHVIVIRNAEDVEYLAAKLHLLPGKLKEILLKLACLEAIDRALYSEGVIWSQHFVDRLRPVYERRKQELPLIPELSGTISPFLLPITEFPIPRARVLTKGTKVKELKEVKNTPLKKPYGEFKNVLLTDEEYGKLKERFNNRITDKIENLSTYLASKGKKYASHYATILSWERKNTKNDDGTPKEQYPVRAL